MRISARELAGVNVLDLTGPLILGDGTVALREQIRGLLAQEKHLILLVFKGVPYIDSCGIGEPVTSFISVRRHGRRTQIGEHGEEDAWSPPVHKAAYRL